MTQPTDKQIECLGAVIEEFSRRFKLAALPDGSSMPNELDRMILLQLFRKPGIGPTEIARVLGVPATTTTSATDRLVRQGLIERARPETDRRAVSLSLTPEGHVLMDVILRAFNGHFAEILRPLTPQERDTLIELLQKTISHDA